jgi:tetrahydromethanopterin S-methyltransferase subunit C
MQIIAYATHVVKAGREKSAMNPSETMITKTAEMMPSAGCFMTSVHPITESIPACLGVIAAIRGGAGLARLRQGKLSGPQGQDSGEILCP